MLDGVGTKYGCGNLDYEYAANVNNAFGSTIVEMSFPYWTNGCIDSAEGLYYESSSSTPFHFLDQSEPSAPSAEPDPQPPLQKGTNVADGIRHLQLTGVRYFLANSPTIEGEAAADPDLTEIASTPANPSEVDVAPGSAAPASAKWVVYLIGKSSLVEPLQYGPVVESMSKSKWLTTAISWYQTEQDWPVPIATNGPASWTRASPGTLVSTLGQRCLPADTVSGIATTQDGISFNVARVGVPVLVKIPYFPNWQAKGATGPYPVTPNLMVVVPTSRHVTITYGTTTVGWIGRIGSTVAGIGGLVAIRNPKVDPARLQPGANLDDHLRPDAGTPPIPPDPHRVLVA